MHRFINKYNMTNKQILLMQNEIQAYRTERVQPKTRRVGGGREGRFDQVDQQTNVVPPATDPNIDQVAADVRAWQLAFAAVALLHLSGMHRGFSGHFLS